MTPAQELYTAAQGRLRHEVDNCKACEGEGYRDCPHGGNCAMPEASCDVQSICEEQSFPCPSCQWARDLLEGKYKCWHYSSGKKWICGNCKTDAGWDVTIRDSVPIESLNPTFTTIESIKQVLVDLRVWEGFVEWHDKQAIMRVIRNTYNGWTRWPIGELPWNASAEILTTPEYFRQAAISYLKEVE